MTPHEEFCLKTATSFSAVRGRTPRQRVRFDAVTMDAAIEYAAQFADGRTMIYAINDLGNSAHIRNA